MQCLQIKALVNSIKERKEKGRRKTNLIEFRGDQKTIPYISSYIIRLSLLGTIFDHPASENK